VQLKVKKTGGVGEKGGEKSRQSLPEKDFAGLYKRREKKGTGGVDYYMKTGSSSLLNELTNQGQGGKRGKNGKKKENAPKGAKGGASLGFWGGEGGGGGVDKIMCLTSWPGGLMATI